MQPRGQAWVYHGDLFYSPNSSRSPGVPPTESSPPIFAPGVSSASEFQHPHWWDPKTEWMAFVPSKPVPYGGIWFESLLYLPKRVPYHSGEGWKLQGSITAQWTRAGQLIWKCAHHLAETNGLSFVAPFGADAWGYLEFHETMELALKHAQESRDWYAMWVGLVYWMTRKTPNAKAFVEGRTPPEWFVQLCQWTQNQAVIDAIRTNPLVNRHYDIERVGVLLHHPADTVGQPSAEWFIDQGVPAWYRWNARESYGGSYQVRGLIAPPPEVLQKATEWISPSPCPLRASDTLSTVPSFDEYPQFENEFPRVPQSPPPNFNDHIPRSTPYSPPPDDNDPDTQPSLVDVRVVTKEDLGRENHARMAWKVFWKDREDLNEKLRLKESAVAREMREMRERVKGTKTAHVFVWEWDLEDRFKSREVRKADRHETVAQYSEEGVVRYDAFLHEWHCCDELGPALNVGNDSSTRETDKSIVKVNGGETAVSGLKAFHFIQHNDCFNNERIQHEVIGILSKHFGFVPPVPFPLTFDGPVSPYDHKTLAAVLGLQGLTPSCWFFETPMGRMCSNFVACLVGKEEEQLKDELWDLAPDNWKMLRFAERLTSIHIIKNKEVSMYMFDFGSESTVPWKLAVYTATTALFVCRLDEDMKEEEIAMELVGLGVPFRTLRPTEGADTAPKDIPASSIVAMRLEGHEFDQDDFDFFKQQCGSLMTLKRSQAALLRGGFAWHVALEYMAPSEVLRGPERMQKDSEYTFLVKDSNGVRYFDDELSDEEYQVLCGTYKTLTGKGDQVAYLSWFPSVVIFEGSGEDVGRWTPHTEGLHSRCVQSILNTNVTTDLRVPLSATKWRNKVRGYKDGRKAMKNLEKWSWEFLKEYAGCSS